MSSEKVFNNALAEENENLRSSLNDLMQNKKFCDITLKTKDGKCFQAHKWILVAACKYFQGLFDNTWIESADNVIELDENIDSEILELVLEYIYNGSVEKEKIDFNKNIKLYNAANFLGMDIFKGVIEKYLIKSLTLQSCFFFLKNDNSQYSDNLPKAIDDYITQNALDFLALYVLDLNSDEIIKIISFKNLNCSQEDLLLNLLKWTKSQFDARQIYIKEFIEKIDFKQVSTDFIEKNIVLDEILFGDKFFAQFIAKELSYNKNKDIFHISYSEKDRNPYIITISDIHELDVDKKDIVKSLEHNYLEGFSVTEFKQNDLFFTYDYSKESKYFSNNEFHDLPARPCDRSYASCAQLNNNIYCCGDTSKKYMDVFDLTRMDWIKPNLQTNIQTYDFNLVQSNGFLYGMMGLKKSVSRYASVVKFDPRVNEWINIQVVTNGKTIESYSNSIAYKDKICVYYDCNIYLLELKNNCLEVIKTNNITNIVLNNYGFTLNIDSTAKRFRRFGYDRPFVYKNALYVLGGNAKNFYKFNDEFEIIEFNNLRTRGLFAQFVL